MAKFLILSQFLALFILFLLVVKTNSDPLTLEEEHELRSFINKLMQCRDTVGLSIALVRDGEAVFTEGFGHRDLNGSHLMTADTKINIGSQTKSFTATLAADTVAKGLADWNTPLIDILGPEFALQDEFRTEQASYRDILAHRLGIPSYWGVTTAATNFTREELCENRLRYFTELYEFRSDWLYSNYPYVLAGHVTEVLTGVTWEDHVTSFFESLGMNETRHAASLTKEDWETNTAYSYIKPDSDYIQNQEQEQLPFLTKICPAGGIFSTANDMAKYLLFHLNKGKNEEEQQVIPEDILSEEYRYTNVVPSSYDIRVPVYPVEDTLYAYGLGWYTGTYRGRAKIYHTGSYSSYNYKMALLPEVEIGVWTCVNSPGDSRGSTAVRLANLFALDILLGETPWLNETTACTFPSPWEPSDIAISEEPRINSAIFDEMDLNLIRQKRQRKNYEAYVGEYEHPGFGVFTVLLDEKGNLRCEFGILLRGLLNESYVVDKFYLILDPPLDYRMTFFPEYPNGFPTYFITNPETSVVEGVYVPYFEFQLPPTFVRKPIESESNL